MNIGPCVSGTQAAALIVAEVAGDGMELASVDDTGAVAATILEIRAACKDKTACMLHQEARSVG
jgi:hypothetical protein